MEKANRSPSNYLVAMAVVVLLSIHAILLGLAAFGDSPVNDEAAHLVAGASNWNLGEFRIFSVNPPLMRIVAAFPVTLASAEYRWQDYMIDPIHRPEFMMGNDFLKANGERSLSLLRMARMACIPFSLLGGAICFFWARDLFGAWSGLLALFLWCVCPNVLAYGHLITPDAGATSLGVTACYVFWRYLRLPSWTLAVIAGVTLGLAQSAKFTWIILFAVYPISWCCYQFFARSHDTNGRLGNVWQLFAILLIALAVINTCYCWEGSFSRLGQYRFYSESLSGSRTLDLDGDNRFIGTWAAHIPIPLPKYYVVGMDIQKRDFDSGRWSYLRGEWRKEGWWYYYLYALAIKTPIGTLLLTALGALLALVAAKYRADWRDEVLLVLPCIAIVGLVSSQTGINHHLRYVMPALPFIFVFASRVGRCIEYKHLYITGLVSICVIGVVASTTQVYPHSLSYFNAFAGGPLRGHEHLGDSNADWGQDLLYLRRWLNDHPDVVFEGVALEPFFTLDIIGFPARQMPPHGSIAQPYRGKLSENSPFPGWYAIGVNKLHSRTKEYEYFSEYEPVDIVGYSIYIYHLTLDDANRVRARVGIPLLGPNDQTEQSNHGPGSRNLN